MSTPKLYFWEGRSVYLGTQFVPLKRYTVTSDQLVVCLSGEIILSDDNDTISCRTILLRAGTEVRMEMADTSNAIIAIAYLNPISQDYAALNQGMAIELQGSHFHHQNEQFIIDQLLKIRDGSMNAGEAFAVFAPILKPADPENFQPTEFDPRIVKSVFRIMASVRENISMQDIADEVHLSESRLVKLFKQQIGIPITRFRLRYRILVGVLHLAMGKSVTDAALAAGFASTAHFSKCHVATMGIQPSYSFLKPPFIDIYIDATIVDRINSVEV